MDISPFIDWEALAKASGKTINFLKLRVTTRFNLEEQRLVLEPRKAEPKQIQELSVQARRVFLNSAEGRVQAIQESSLPFDRVCLKEDGYVCFSSDFLHVAKTVEVKKDDLDPLIRAAWECLVSVGGALDWEFFQNLPRQISTYRNPPYKFLSINEDGSFAAYPGLPKAAWKTKALRWRRWSRVLGLHLWADRSWKSTLLEHEGATYLVLGCSDQLVISRLKPADEATS